jgi:hypothetical protein
MTLILMKSIAPHWIETLAHPSIEKMKADGQSEWSALPANPGTYRYKQEIDRTQSLAFGLIAEEVAEVNPGLVACNAQGQPESVHYEMVNAMLLNEFLKEHKEVERLEATVGSLAATVKEHAAQIQKVRARLELSKRVQRTVVSDPWGCATAKQS